MMPLRPKLLMQAQRLAGNDDTAEDLVQETMLRLWEMRQQLKALIARDLWSMNEYFAVMNEQSDIVQRALQLIEK